jgi:hypothetical protein
MSFTGTSESELGRKTVQLAWDQTKVEEELEAVEAALARLVAARGNGDDESMPDASSVGLEVIGFESEGQGLEKFVSARICK